MRFITHLVFSLAVLSTPVAASALPPLPARVIQLGRQNDPLVQAGYLPVTFYGADPSGAGDSTSAINAAIVAARDSGLVAYVPAGTYRVSNTLTGVQRHQVWNCAEHFGRPLAGEVNVDYGTGWPMRKAPSLVGPSSGPRPILRLVDNAPGFTDPNNPRSVIHMYSNGPGYGFEKPYWGQYDCGMGIHVRNLEIQLGNGNAGAVGVRVPTAQWSLVQNVRVVANGAFAGFQGIVHTHVNGGLEVVGGRYGIILELGSETVVGARLINQTLAAVVVSAYSPATLVGVEIEKATGPAILIDNSGRIQGPQTSQLTVVDSRILVAGGSAPLIANIANEGAGRSLILQDVWMAGGTGALVRSGGTELPRAAGGAWTHVKRYGYGDPTARSGVTTESYVSGSRIGTAFSEVAAVATAPGDLRTRHELPLLPTFDSPGVVNAKSLGARGDGTTDDTSALQAAFDRGGFVFLPVGDYLISRALVLRSTSRVMGMPGGRSRLVTRGMASGEAMLRTVDDANATILVSDLQLLLDGNNTRQGVDWKAGRNSIVSDLYTDIPWTTDMRGAARALVRISGNGGGRFYSPMVFQQYNGASDHPEHRTLLIEGTRAPLTFYSGNMEYSNALMIEVRNSANVRFIGGNKTEVRKQLLWLNNSSNIMHTGTTGHCQFDFGVTCSPSRRGNFDLIRVTGGNNILLGNQAMYVDSHHMNATVVDDGVARIDGANSVAYYEKGRFDTSAFPRCGDGVCDTFVETGTCGDCGGAPTPTPPPLPAPTTPLACTLGGDVNDDAQWASAVPIDLDPSKALNEAALGITAPPTGPSDLSAKVRVGWNATHLYVRVDVTDDIITTNGGAVYNQDGVELYLDMNAARSTTYDTNDWQLTATAAGRVGGVRGVPPGTNVTSLRTASGYRVIYVVPLQAAGGSASAGAKLGFDIAINDSDGAARTTQLMWSGYGYGFRDTSRWNTLTLSQDACGASGEPDVCRFAGDVGGAAAWTGAYPIELDASFAVNEPALGITAAPTNDADASARVTLGWTDQALLVRAVVQDDTVHTTNDPVYAQDGIELYLDLKNDHGDTYGADDWQLTATAAGRTGGVRGLPSGTTVSTARLANGYEVRYTVPWTSLGLAPSAGASIGVDVAVNDSDGSGRTTQLMWSGDAYGFRDTSAWTSLRLTPRSCAGSALLLETPSEMDAEPASGCAAVSDVSSLVVLVVLALIGCALGRHPSSKRSDF